MKAKLVHLTERQFEYLQAKAGELGISVSELIRRILDSNMDDGKAPPSRNGESASRKKV